jgi:hypothetical protein
MHPSHGSRERQNNNSSYLRNGLPCTREGFPAFYEKYLCRGECCFYFEAKEEVKDDESITSADLCAKFHSQNAVLFLISNYNNINYDT